jgi:hypothetical protein
MAGAILDLVAFGRENQVLGLEQVSSRDVRSVPFEQPVGFGREISVRMPRNNGDCLGRIWVHLRVRDAPPGWRWKENWVYSFLERVQIQVGGSTILETNTQQLQVEHHVHGKTYLQDGNEILIEPFKVDEIFLGKYKIPLICLAFHEVTYRIRTGTARNCLEPIQENPPDLPADLNLIEMCELSCECNYYDTDERRELARGTYSCQPVRYNEYSSETFDRVDRLQFSHTQFGVCSAAYLWITDEHNNEIPEALDSIEIRLHNQTRWNLSALQAKRQTRNFLPHPVQDTNLTSNLYFIPHFSGRRTPGGVEGGLNLSRIDDYRWILDLKQTAPPRIKVHIVHRIHNQFEAINGFGRLAYDYHAARFRNINRNALDVRPQVVEFTNTDQQITIPADDFCLITYQNFEEGQQVDQCNQCHKIVLTEALQRWLNGKSPAQQKCIHCSFPYNPMNFKRGKAHVT